MINYDICNRFIVRSGRLPDSYEYMFLRGKNFRGIVKYWFNSLNRGVILRVEFDRRVMALIAALSLFRVIFIHIPKTAGTSIVESVEEESNAPIYRFGSIDPVDIEHIYGQLDKCNQATPCFFSGHVWIRHLSAYMCLGEDDELFAVYRPLDSIHASIINYSANKVASNKEYIERLLGSNAGLVLFEKYREALITGNLDSPTSVDEDLIFHFVLMKSLGPFSRDDLLLVFESMEYRMVYGGVYKNYLLLGDEPTDYTIIHTIGLKLYSAEDLYKRFRDEFFLFNSERLRKSNTTNAPILVANDLSKLVNILDPVELELDSYLKNNLICGG